jgi:hypothetical protein
MEDTYARRMAAKKVQDKSGDTFWKLMMNNLYGKMGQKINPKTEFVSAEVLQYRQLTQSS